MLSWNKAYKKIVKFVKLKYKIEGAGQTAYGDLERTKSFEHIILMIELHSNLQNV